MDAQFEGGVATLLREGCTCGGAQTFTSRPCSSEVRASTRVVISLVNSVSRVFCSSSHSLRHEEKRRAEEAGEGLCLQGKPVMAEDCIEMPVRRMEAEVVVAGGDSGFGGGRFHGYGSVKGSGHLLHDRDVHATLDDARADFTAPIAQGGVCAKGTVTFP